MAKCTELPSSELGTKEYWDSQYKNEFENFEHHGDIGEIWFEDSMDRVLQWVLETNLLTKQSSVIDIGCGNGAFLLHLAAEGFTQLYGIDYSEKAVELARAVATSKEANITYKHFDILNSGSKSLSPSEYDLCADKGTYDAISLCPDDPASKREAYVRAVHRMTHPNSIFLITSCNWTREELEQHFAEYFLLEHVIPMPTFMFGGKIGSRVTSLVFKRKA